MLDISVIIVNYNVRDFLDNALVSIQKALPGLKGEIVVVDNASDDGSLEMLERKFPDVRVIANKQNLGFAKANNQALQQARGKYLLLINPDTLVQEDTLRVMIQFFENNPDVGLTTCKILRHDGSFALSCRRSFPSPWVAFTKLVGLAALFPKSKLFGKYNLTYLSPDESYEVDAVSGSFMMLRREVYERVGGLDEEYFMYGEDLDWCYRIQKAGWKIYYVPTTKIIHYHGESTKRSNIDELRTFYQAMHLFVKKHLSASLWTTVLLRLGIMIRAGIAFLGKTAKSFFMALMDMAVIAFSVWVGEYLYFGRTFNFPGYAYPTVFIVPAIVFVVVLFSAGVYTYRKLSLVRTVAAVAIGFFIISSLTYFFKNYAFSRAVVIISSVINLIALPGWRMIFKILSRGKGREEGRKGLFGRRTLIVGTDVSGQEVLRKLRTRLTEGYDVVGFIDINRRHLGEKIGGVKILGSVDNIGKVIQENKISEVIFSTDALSYTDILSIIGRSRDRSVNFRLVPTSLEVIIGKTHIDQLDDIPLVDIDYNIDRFSNRIVKRAFDIVLSIFLLLLVYPFVILKHALRSSTSAASRSALLQLPNVLKGAMSFVGPIVSKKAGEKNSPDIVNYGMNASLNGGLYLGKSGLTGLVQLRSESELTREEIERYNIYYAKNQSLLLDIEVLLKSLGRRQR
jgi:GT2 family glycosyltransferase/lipopolysaccharide/colanic/teichoic acid biosynthesis glycosyltransferase